MRYQASHRDILWTIILAFTLSTSLHGCSDVNNVSAPHPAPAPPGPLTILTSDPLPAGTVQADYNVTLAAIGGTPPYTWSLAPGSPTLPNGLALTASTGKILGVPTTATATRLIEFKLQDSTGQSVQQVLAITVNTAPTPLTILTGSLPTGLINQPYAVAFSGTGGTTPYMWGLKSGSPPLPSGLTLDPGGVLSGTPTVTSTATHTFTLTDATSLTVEKSLQLSIQAIPLSITTPSLPNGTVGQSYTAPLLTASGGTAPYTWSLNSGSSLPPGLSLGADGSITGTPTTVGTTSTPFTVQDSTSTNPQSATTSISITINSASVPPTITTDSLPEGKRNQVYAATLAASGGTSPYTWSVTPALPAGLMLDPATGVISGIPTATSTSDLDFTVQDSTNQTTTKQLTLRIRH
jgi:hypothetical protein